MHGCMAHPGVGIPEAAKGLNRGSRRESKGREHDSRGRYEAAQVDTGKGT